VRCDLGNRPEQPTKPRGSSNVIGVIIVPPSRIKKINRIGCLNAESVVPASIFYTKAVKCMADPPDSGRYLVRGSGHGRFSTGRGSRATGHRFLPVRRYRSCSNAAVSAGGRAPVRLILPHLG
jgi:hypothetical protein